MKMLNFPISPCIAPLFAGLITAATAQEMPPGIEDAIDEALPEEAYAEPDRERTILVFSKTAGFRHDSIPTGKYLLEQMGEETGAYETVISDDLANFEPNNLREFDAVVFLSTTGNVFEGVGEEKQQELKQSLMGFVRSGRGFVGIHAATDTFYGWPEYGEMLNGYFNGHPWHAGSQVHIMVEPGEESHPLVKMFEGDPVEFREEIYEFRDPYDSDKVHMLMRLDPEKSDDVQPKRDDGDFGVSWARHWGDGRVFYSSLGHNHEIFAHPKVMRHFLAGIQWATGDLEAEVEK